MSKKIYSNNNLKFQSKEELKMFNRIKRIHHFEANGQSYTAYINLDADMKVIDTTLPPISIKNDDNPTEYYNVYDDGCDEYISLECYIGSLNGSTCNLRTIFFDKQHNALPLSVSENLVDEEEDDIANAEYYKVPCDKLLAALICYYCGIFDVVSLVDFDKEHEVTDDLFTIKDFVIED